MYNLGCWWIFMTGDFQPRLLKNIFSSNPCCWRIYIKQVTSNPLCWRIFVTGEFQPMLLENIYDRCDQKQTAGIVTKSGSVYYSPDRLIKMLLSQARRTKFWYTWIIQRSSSCVKLRLCQTSLFHRAFWFIKFYSHQLMHFFIQLCISLLCHIKIT